MESVIRRAGLNLDLIEIEIKSIKNDVDAQRDYLSHLYKNIEQTISDINRILDFLMPH